VLPVSVSYELSATMKAQYIELAFIALGHVALGIIIGMAI
jgi:hypothetical protein